MFELVHDFRVKIPCTNTRVFGHNGHPEQVRNEVYNWLREFAGSKWVERNYRNAPTMPMASRKKYSTRPFTPSFTSGKISGKYFYFSDMKLAVLFKLAWAGEV